MTVLQNFTLLFYKGKSAKKLRGFFSVAMLCSFVLFSGALSGCAGAGLVVGAGAAVGSMALEERGLQQAGLDKLSEARIAQAISAIDIKLFNAVSAEVMEGRVLLTGQIPREDHRSRVVQIAFSDPNTLEVINDIFIGPHLSVTQAANDLRILTTLQARLLADPDILSVNYGFEVKSGRISVLGIAQNQMEVRRLTNHASNIPGVEAFLPHILAKDSADRQALLDRLKARKSEEKKAGG